MSSIRYAVVGSRDWKEPWLVKALVFELFQKDPDGIIVSGGARGVDSFAEEEADILHMGKLIFPAQWERYGKSAGPIRNKLIVENADVVYAFRNKGSIGTQNTIDVATKKGLMVHIKEPMNEHPNDPS